MFGDQSIDFVVFGFEVMVLVCEVMVDFFVFCVCEGEKLVIMIVDCVNVMCDIVVQVVFCIFEVQVLFIDKLWQCLYEVFGNVSDDCILQEVVVFVMCIDVVEEFSCFLMYFDEVECVLKQGGVCGKCFDFLMQEFNCEVNMLGFKFVIIEVLQVVMVFKLFIE